VRAFVAAVASLVALVPAAEAMACTCIAAPATQRLDSADAAFIGRLVTTRATPEPGPIKNAGREIVYVFTVDHVVKGDLGRRVEVLSPASGAACGFEVRSDEAAGILLRRDRGSWTGGLCGQIAVGELLAAAEEVDEPLVNWGGVVVGAAVILLGALLLARRLRRRQSALR
jgi:hypothetical protein